VYSDTQTVTEDILAILVHNFYWNVYRDVYKCVVVGSWMQINLIIQVHLSCDRQQVVVLLSTLWRLQVSRRHVWVCKKTKCKVNSTMPLEKIFLYLYPTVCDIFSDGWNVCCCGLKNVEWYHFPIKQSTVALLMNIQCLHQDYMAIRRWWTNKMWLITFFKLCLITFWEMCTVMCRKCVMVWTKGRWISFWTLIYGDTEWNLQFSPKPNMIIWLVR
jgi:hypothetical protein